MKWLRKLLLVPLLMAFQCDDEINAEEDLLFESGIYAGWQLTSQSIDGISDLTPLPETLLEFYPDNNTQDNRGEYNLEELSANIVGVFIMDQTEQTITFKREGSSDVIYDYTINSDKDFITFSFTESDAQFEQGWTKRF
ncbi:hypothetical protein [Croceitalea rosinachiae]|uniref:Lipocalin-like domain-containing protein n=1 Tax=Croceitalea rosinachiae TaxID=3075596 RepID=A0ABU3ADQ9_9FLAO|nr:hypothetical protein [Croceitalea sp. F388]MDT0608321.1 hypothetical protein [Croceitalea sp. F388]